jgi:hypothetical protein
VDRPRALFPRSCLGTLPRGLIDVAGVRGRLGVPSGHPGSGVVAIPPPSRSANSEIHVHRRRRDTDDQVIDPEAFRRQLVPAVVDRYRALVAVAGTFERARASRPPGPPRTAVPTADCSRLGSPQSRLSPGSRRAGSGSTPPGSSTTASRRTWSSGSWDTSGPQQRWTSTPGAPTTATASSEPSTTTPNRTTARRGFPLRPERMLRNCSGKPPSMTKALVSRLRFGALTRAFGEWAILGSNQ